MKTILEWCKLVNFEHELDKNEHVMTVRNRIYAA